MNDTSDLVKQKQLEIWLSKPPMERLRLTLETNDELFSFWNEAKKNLAEQQPQILNKKAGTMPGSSIS